jgi:hypothetical protein
MSSRLVLILWLVAIALGGAVFAVKSNQRDQARSLIRRNSGQTLFEKFPAADVASIAITGAEGTAHLRKKDGKWVVTDREDYTANVGTVHDLLRTVEELKVIDGIEAGPAYASRFGMEETSSDPAERGLTVAFADANGKELAKLSVGKALGAEPANPMMGGGASGRFVRDHADDSGIYKTSEIFASLSAEPKRWLAEDFLLVQKPVAISVTQPGKDELAWKLTRENEEAAFSLADAKPEEKPEATSLAPYKSLLSYARFEDIVPAAEAEKRSETGRRQTAIITTVEGFTYELTLTPAKPAEKKADAETPNEATYFLTVKVDASLPKERKKEADEKPEDAQQKDAAFASRLKELQDKLAKEKALEGRTFEVSRSTVDALLKDRAAFFQKEAPPSRPAASPMMFPGGR